MSSTPPLTIRPPRPDEVDAVTAMLNEHSRRLHGKSDMTAESLAWYWRGPDVDLERDVAIAESPEGALVGYVDLGVFGDAVWVDLRGVEPGSLTPLLAAAETRAAEKKPGVVLRGWAHETDSALREVYDKSGYTLIRHSFRMEIDLGGDVSEPSWPEGVTVRTFRPGDERQVYEAQMGSFADTWAFSREPFEEWEHWFRKGPGFDPKLWFLAESAGEIAGISLCRVHETESDMGWVNILGVVPAHRRQGLATALLQHSFQEFERRGFARAGLGVDAQNPTGALRVYERAGMSVARTSVHFEKPAAVPDDRVQR